MKRALLVLLALSVVFAVISCGEKDSAKAEKAAEKKQEEKDLSPTETVEAFFDSMLVDAETYVGLLSSTMQEALE